MDTARLAAIRAREQAASPGPWELSDWTEDDGPNATTLTAYRLPATDLEARLVSQVSPGRWPIAIAELGEGVSPADAAFLLHARQDVPDLLAEIDRLRAVAPQIEAEIARTTAETHRSVLRWVLRLLKGEQE